MTNMERLTAMRQADFIKLCEEWGVKVRASKGKLKEKRMPVQERLIAAGWPDGKKTESAVEDESAEEEVVEAVQQETSDEPTNTEQKDNTSMSDNERELIDALENFSDIYPDITVEEIGYNSYELRRDNEHIGIITPCKDNVIIAFTAVEEFGYDAVVDKIAEIIG